MPFVQAVRHLLAQRRLAVLICVATLLLKLVIPSGYMIGNDQGRITISICSGTVPRKMTLELPGVHSGMTEDTRPMDHGKAEMPCAFSSLSAAMLGSIDPVQLAALIVFILATGLVATIPPAPAHPAYLRPPLRGPPAYL